MMDFYILGFCPVYFTVFWELENLICNFCYQLVIFVEVPVTEDYVADKPWICLFYISILLDSTLTIPYHLLLSFLFLLKLYGFNFCKNSLHEVMLLQHVHRTPLPNGWNSSSMSLSNCHKFQFVICLGSLETFVLLSKFMLKNVESCKNNQFPSCKNAM